MRLPGLGPKTAARIWKELGVTTLAELKAAAEGERLRGLAGLGAKSEEKILKALAFKAENTDAGRRLLGDGLPAVQAAVAALREHPAAVHVSEAGSVRRRKETGRDLDVIATATNTARSPPTSRELPRVEDGRGARRREGDGRLRGKGRFDLRVVPPESYGNLLQHFTGSKEHNVAMRKDAVRRGLSVSEYGVTTVETGEVFRTEDEDALYEYLGYQPIVPELREDNGESRRRSAASFRRSSSSARCAAICARRALVREREEHARGDGRGDDRAGYAYYAITDHSLVQDGRLAGAAGGNRAVASALSGAEDPRRRRGEHPTAARSTSPEEDLERLDWVVAPSTGAGDSSDGEGARGDGEPVRRLHRPSHRSPIGTRGPRDVDVERVLGEGGRDRRLPRNQRAAGPARPLRRPCAGREAGGGEARRQLRRAPGRARRATSSWRWRRRGAAG